MINTGVKSKTNPNTERRQFEMSKFKELKFEYPQKSDKQILSLVNKSWEQITNAKNKNSPSTVKMEANFQEVKFEDQQVQIRARQRLFSPASENMQQGPNQQEKNKSERSSIKSTPVKRIRQKPIKKQAKKTKGEPKTQYLKFFKFYYDKLSKQHPLWKGNQITTIIKLLWKRKRNTDKNTQATLQPIQKAGKVMGPRAYFNNQHQGMPKEQVAKIWKQLPRQSKKYFVKKGALKKQTSKIPNMSIINLQSSQEKKQPTFNGLSFLNKKI